MALLWLVGLSLAGADWNDAAGMARREDGDGGSSGWNLAPERALEYYGAFVNRLSSKLPS